MPTAEAGRTHFRALKGTHNVQWHRSTLLLPGLVYHSGGDAIELFVMQEAAVP